MNEKTNNLVIFSSPNKNSFTVKILNQTLLNLEGETKVFDCYKERPIPCDGCGFCKKNEGCNKGDLKEFFKDFEAADNIIFAFPVYNGSFPAPLKALIDRFQPYFSDRFVKGCPSPKRDRHNVTLVMTMGAKKDLTDLILAQIQPLFTITGCTLKKAVVLTDTDNLDKEKSLKPIITNF